MRNLDFHISEGSVANVDYRLITVSKPIPYTFDLGNLLINDANPLPSNPTDAHISTAVRDCAQALINQLLATCPIHSSADSGMLITLPPPETPLPREKPLPAQKQQTTWEKFAKKKGIKDKKKGEGKMVYDEEKEEWVPKWGYKGKNKDGEGDWIVEVKEKKEKEVDGRGDGSALRGEGRRERKDKVRRNERKERANERKGRKSGVVG